MFKAVRRSRTLPPYAVLAATHGDLSKQPFTGFCRKGLGKSPGFCEAFQRPMKRLNIIWSHSGISRSFDGCREPNPDGNATPFSTWPFCTSPR